MLEQFMAPSGMARNKAVASSDPAAVS